MPSAFVPASSTPSRRVTTARSPPPCTVSVTAGLRTRREADLADAGGAAAVERVGVLRRDLRADVVAWLDARPARRPAAVHLGAEPRRLRQLGMLAQDRIGARERALGDVGVERSDRLARTIELFFHAIRDREDRSSPRSRRRRRWRRRPAGRARVPSRRAPAARRRGPPPSRPKRR